MPFPRFFLLICTLLLSLSACARTAAPARKAFLTGVDASFAPAMAERGLPWKAGDKPVDLLAELHRCGADAFRVRVWTGDDGPSGRASAVALALRAQKAGLKPCLVFFLSEDWSDYVKQPAPATWQKMSLSDKAAQVTRYARDTARCFQEAGVDTDLYAIGNEIDFGLCGEFEEDWGRRFNLGYMSDRVWPRESEIVRAAQDGILEVNPRAKFILHLTQWWNPDFCSAFLEAMDREKVRVDYLGLTFYPTSGLAPGNTLADLSRCIEEIQAKHKVPVIVCEYAYPSQERFDGQFSTWNKRVEGYPLDEAGQARWIADFLVFCRQHPDIHGAFYWSPEWYAEEMWKAFALFREDGAAKPGLAALAPAAR